MKVLHICSLYSPYIIGGAEISTQFLVEELHQNIDVYVITTSNELTHTKKINNIPITYIKQKNIYWKYPSRDKSIFKKLIYHFIDIYNYKYRKEINKIIFEYNPDIIHTHNLCGISTYVWKLAKLKNIPIVHTLRDYYLLCPKQSMEKNGISCKKQCLSCYLFSIVKKQLSKNVSAVVGISNYILSKHIDYGYFKKSKIAISIPNSVVLSEIENSKKYSIGYIGRISPEKGLEYLIDSFLKTNNIQYNLRIAGSGNDIYVKYLKNKYKSNNNVIFEGYQKQNTFFQSIDLLVVPSFWDEPFGRVVIESYSYGIPVFVSNRGGLIELINENVGLIIDLEKEDDLKNKLQMFFNNKISFDSKNIKDEIIKKYSNNFVAGLYTNLYKNLIHENSFNT